MKVIISLKASMDYRTCVSNVCSNICVRELFCTLDIQVISLLHRIELCLFKPKVWWKPEIRIFNFTGLISKLDRLHRVAPNLKVFSSWNVIIFPTLSSYRNKQLCSIYFVSKLLIFLNSLVLDKLSFVEKCSNKPKPNNQWWQCSVSMDHVNWFVFHL